MKFGNEVTLFTSAYDGCETETFRSGIRIIRKGGRYGVYLKARKFAKKHLREYDIIIDEINTIPFLSYRIAKDKPLVALIHQLAREIWFYETRFPISHLGYFALEPLWLRGYRRIPTITVSNSTKTDLLKVGFQKVFAVHNGISTQPLSKMPEKASNPVLIFVGRLVRSKHPDHAISAFSQVKKALPNAELWMVGEGYMRKQLTCETDEGVTFFGRVEESKKIDLLSKAHVLLMPSVREGWGISAIEANSVGTPTVGYRVPGLVDSIVDGSTGYLVRPFDVDALSKATIEILSDRTTLQNLSENALVWSRNFHWDKAANEFLSILNNVVRDSDRLGNSSQSLTDHTDPDGKPAILRIS